MNGQIDSLASPGLRRVVFLVNVVQFWLPGLQNGARTPDQIDKTEHFVETKRSFSLFVASTDRLAALQLANLTVFGALLVDFSPKARGTKTAIPLETVTLFIRLDRSAPPGHQILQNHCKTQVKVTLLLVLPLF